MTMSSESKFAYRTLSSDDASAWRALRIEGARGYPLGFLLTEEETEAQGLKACARILRFGNTRGVFAGGKLIGFCGYRRESLERTKHRAEIGPFFVTEPHQGGGAAAALMKGVIDEAKADGVSQLELFVDTENHRAIAFYEKAGFERVGFHPDGVRIDGVSRDDFFYVLRINAV